MRSSYPCACSLNSFLSGELREWQIELNNEESLERKKDAMKKVIATMTVGKDVSALFPDVVKCSQTNNIELKKLVYLYIINYAKTQEEEAVMAVNTFTQVSSALTSSSPFSFLSTFVCSILV